jgi:hypothetical protein
MLVQMEIWHNLATLRTVSATLEMTLKEKDVVNSVLAFRDSALLPKWQRSRWNLPDVGVAFSLEELARRAEWYFELDGLVFLQERLDKQIRS